MKFDKETVIKKKDAIVKGIKKNSDKIAVFTVTLVGGVCCNYIYNKGYKHGLFTGANCVATALEKGLENTCVLKVDEGEQTAEVVDEI